MIRSLVIIVKNQQGKEEKKGKNGPYVDQVNKEVQKRVKNSTVIELYVV